MAWRIGVDSGGTFTDICLFSESSGEVVIWKVSSTPDDPSRAILSGIVEGLAHVGATCEEVSFLGHGTTVATNALIQGKGVKTGLITTKGFSDLLEIGRQKRPDLYDPQTEKPPILVPRPLRIGVEERLLNDGSVDTPLDEEGLRQAARFFKEQGVESIAVCFLYSFLKPDHEIRAGEILAQEMPGAFLALSHKVAPEFREFERLSTTVVNAALGPVMRHYVKALERKLDELGIKVAAQLTQSNGGVMGFDTAADLPVRTVLSGPSTGVVAAQALGALAGYDNLITFDMGGTSSDVALLTNGHCQTVSESVVHGYPLKAPMLDIHTVGAGGGSIAYIDHGGFMKVGPRSAGANPGPACYDLGNSEATVTDANVLLQTQNPQSLLGNRMPINQERSRQAIARLAERLGMGLYETANGILDIVIANMAKAIRVISVQRGYDPREYALVAFGGAGPVHAVRLARELGMSKVLVPSTPGVLCALGLLMTDLRTDFSMTRLVLMEEANPALIQSFFDALEVQAESWFERERIDPVNRLVSRIIDVRYGGQNYELPVVLPEGVVTMQSLQAVSQGFLEAHKQRYGFVAEGEAIQMVTFRLSAQGQVNKAQLRPAPFQGADASDAMVGSRQVWMPEVGDFVTTTLYDRARLGVGNVITGPAIIDQMDSTTVLAPDCTATVDAHLNLVLEV